MNAPAGSRISYTVVAAMRSDETGTDCSSRDPETEVVIGAAIEVHRQLGHGFAEGVYQEALAIEFAQRGVRHQPQPRLRVLYKGSPLQCAYQPDFICHDRLIVELKAIAALSRNDHAQVINYLKVTGHRKGLLLNFGSPRLEIKRLVFDQHLCSSAPSVDRSSEVTPRPADRHA